MSLKRPAVIVDLDGTIADLNGRSPYKDDQPFCDQDLVREDVLLFIMNFVSLSTKSPAVIFVSGRFELAREATLRWFQKNGIVGYEALFMRQDDDTRSDDVIKAEIYKESIQPHYQVLAVFDDRPKVIRMWESHGLHVFDVGHGIEF